MGPGGDGRAAMPADPHVIVTALKEGDMIDLHDSPCANVASEFEYAIVEGWERETADCVRLDTDQGSWGVSPKQTFIRFEG
jgi:hypothetical protein